MAVEQPPIERLPGFIKIPHKFEGPNGSIPDGDSLTRAVNDVMKYYHYNPRNAGLRSLRFVDDHLVCGPDFYPHATSFRFRYTGGHAFSLSLGGDWMPDPPGEISFRGKGSWPDPPQGDDDIAAERYMFDTAYNLFDEVQKNLNAMVASTPAPQTSIALPPPAPKTSVPPATKTAVELAS